MDNKKIVEGLNPEQSQAVLSDNPWVIIKAGAGTGKTSALTRRIARLGCEHPEGLVAMTFTRKAANEMKERVEGILGEDAEMPFIGTMHSFCNRLIRKNIKYLGISHFTVALNEEVKPAFESAYLRLYPGADLKDPEISDDFKDKMKNVMRWKENGLLIDDINKENLSDFSDNIVGCINFYKFYQEELEKRDLMDASDLTLNAIRILENNPNILRLVHKHMKYILVDEFQDTNLSQIRLLKLLVGPDTGFTCVGDDDQSLYSFRGSIPGLMDKIPDVMNMNNPEIIHLIRNYRCTDNVLRIANRMVDYNPRMEPKVLESGREGDDIVVSGFATAKQEAKDIVKKMKALNKRGKGVPWSEMAVLCRVSRPLTTMENALITAKIPYEMLSGTSFLNKTEVVDIISYLHIAVNPKNDFAFWRISGRPSRKIGPVLADKIVKFMEENDVTVFDAIRLMIEQKKITGKVTIDIMDDFLRQLQWLNDAYLTEVDVSRVIDYIIHTIKYNEYVMKQDEPERRMAVIEQLEDIAKTYSGNMDDFLSDISLSNANVVKKNCVTLGTIHGSKGLEWDEVFMMAFENNVMPITKKKQPMWNGDIWDLTDMSGIEEEARMAHVGITRSRQHTHISFAIDRNPGSTSSASKFLTERGEMEVPKVEAKHLKARAAWAQRNNYQKNTRGRPW